MCLVFTQLFIMESVSCKWLLLWFLYLSWAHSALALDELNGAVVKGVNLGGWLVLEGFITRSLFEGIPNREMLDGTKVQFRSLSLNKYVSAQKGGDSGIVTVDIDKADTWETFRLWRLSERDFQLRTLHGQFLSCDGEGATVLAKSVSPDSKETFSIEKNDDGNVYIKHSSGKYLQVSGNELRADHEGIPTRDEYGATFHMIINGSMKGDYQLGNGYGLETATEVLRNHRSNFVTQADFQFLSRNGINTVRIPVGWWIAQDPPPAPYVGGSLEYLDKAFEWAQLYEMKCIIDLHAAPGSQNGMEHSSSRDGTIDWPTSEENIKESLRAIDFLASKYGNHDALLGIELLNEPHAPNVSPGILKKYYKDGYDIVRRHSDKAYVIMCQRIGEGSNLTRLYNAIADMGLSKVVFDLHYYNLYIDLFFNKSPQQNIDYIKNERKSEIKSLNAGPLVFIGEWTNQFGNGGYSSIEYQKYGKAQLAVYGSASFGWAYWTLKIEKNRHWDLMWNIKNKTLQL
ncbi:glucan 1,3-beta-glucosidase A-like [Papaver somniferum]|uniref:glucan 1,3-beta-glucosidase A-like n=1 Tax=Papaver somniferum TaxID=3469 RepID=UPI000E704EC2|nr:glucan 1,3-beta-glucosidase A-like [Papaver somniferum]